MVSRLISPSQRVAQFSLAPIDAPRISSLHTFPIEREPRRASIALGILTLAALTFATAASQAQRPYPQQYGSGNPYAGQSTQPSQQYGYPQQQPQYGQSAQPYGYPQQQYPAQQPQYGAAQPYANQKQYANQQPYADQGYPSEQDLAPPPAAPAQALNAAQLEQMLAPIALYPDALLAQILAASTYPAQVTAADQWLQQMRAQGYGSPDQIAAGASAQTTWDPSVKALTAFPDVLDMLSHNLEWTTALGNAYYNQPQDVMQTVQVLRQRAQQAGNLQTTPQEDVNNDQGYINIAPPNPEQVYVPTYNPWGVYGQQIAPYPGFSLFGALGDFFGGLPIQYGLSFALGAFEHTPFGLLAWGLDWLAHAILFDHGDWNSHSTSLADWGLPHGGPRAFPGWDRGPVTARRNFDNGGGRYGYNQRGGQSGFEGRSGNFGRQDSSNPYNSRGNEWGRGGDESNRGNQNYGYNRGSGELNRGSGELNRGSENTNRGNQPSYNGYTHPESPAYAHQTAPGQQAYYRAPQPANAYRPQQAYANPGYGYHPQTYPNRPPSYASRPQTPAFSGSGYGSGYANRGTQAYGQTYGSRAGYGSTNPYSTYRAPQSDSRGYSSRAYPSYGNYARNESGGFRGFGGEKAPKYSAPKYSYKAPKSFGRQSFGHEKAPKAPKMGHSSGGGHSGGGHKHFL